jgi:phosphohistidine phosphatase
LLGGSDGDWAFKKGAIWWLQSRQRDGDNEVVVRAALSPELL